eukprot:CAMPEP_0116976558 /NCGR_PEP_ID=MMETSP0467-20121206/56574_1 /TAXON_ID=283647 /ORGANISM="Mesodinium pulex, Strain SPMC105" /LENGTH=36 /DNA_ID= /DNA_START= /DNA_END= /DNA_ORIENTATION=
MIKQSYNWYAKFDQYSAWKEKGKEPMKDKDNEKEKS